jgi:hypothetical protein
LFDAQAVVYTRRVEIHQQAARQRVYAEGARICASCAGVLAGRLDLENDGFGDKYVGTGAHRY